MSAPIATGHYAVRRLPVSTVERKIGPSALLVLRMLWRWRDDEGVATVTRENLAGSTFDFAKLSVDCVRLALRRLSECGLVENLGWRKVRARGGGLLEAYARRVYGAEVESPIIGERAFLAVPEPVAAWISRRTADATRGGGRGRGGAPRGNDNWRGSGASYRPRAARRRLARTLEDVRRGRVKVDSPAARLEASEARERSKRSERARVNGSRRGGSMDRAAYSLTSGSLPPDLSLRERSGAAAPPAASASSVAPSALEVNPDAKRPIRSADDHGLRLGTPTHSKRATFQPRGLPGYPTIRSATIPNPPTIAEDASPEEAAHALASAYRGAFEAATGKPCWVARVPQVVRSKVWALLLEAGVLLRDAAIPPAGWVVWSFDVWRGLGRTKKPPSMAWCFSTKRIAGDLKWYQHEGYDEIGGRRVKGPLEDAFYPRDAAMREAAIWTDDATEVVARYFPEGYAQAVQAVQREADQMREKVARRLAAGEWLWS